MDKKINWIGSLVRLWVVTLMFSGASAWCAFEHVSEADLAFFNRLVKQESVLERLGSLARLQINEAIFPVDRGRLGTSSPYFLALFTSGMQESQSSVDSQPGQIIIAGKVIVLEDISEDAFLKILRLIYEDQFDSAESADLLAEIHTKLDYFQLGREQLTLISLSGFSETAHFAQAVEILEKTRDLPRTDKRIAVLARCKSYLERFDFYPYKVAGFMENFGLKYFRERVPAAVEILEHCTGKSLRSSSSSSSSFSSY